MSNSKHNLLLSACRSGFATTQECERMSHAAGMWACGEHKITKAEVALAETVLSRSNVADAGKSLAILTAESQGYLPRQEIEFADAWGKDEIAEYTEEANPLDGADTVRITATTGKNISRKFLVKKTAAGFVRGFRTFPTLAAAAGGFAAKI
jgi:hypothetical protein